MNVDNVDIQYNVFRLTGLGTRFVKVRNRFLRANAGDCATVSLWGLGCPTPCRNITHYYIVTDNWQTVSCAGNRTLVP